LLREEKEEIGDEGKSAYSGRLPDERGKAGKSVVSG